MSDISIQYNNETQTGDLCFSSTDLNISNPLETAILISLFSDRLAPDQLSAQDKSVGVQVPGNALHAMQSPRQGWWGDALDGDFIGSRLWQLKRIVRANKQNILLEIEAVIHEALAWLSDDGIVSTFTVSAVWSPTVRNAVNFSIIAYQPTGPAPQNFEFSLAWDGLRRS